jgi:hypothetical protein
MATLIPAAVISVVADSVSIIETHASLDSLFMYAEAPNEPPVGSKHVKALEWLRQINRDSDDPLSVLGKIVEGYMDDPETAPDAPPVGRFMSMPMLEEKRKFCRKFEATLARFGMTYRQGGRISTGATAPSRSLEEIIKGKDFPAVLSEFDRALEHVEKEPRESLSAACNILESVFKIYIEDNGLSMPARQDLQGVFKVVRADLGLDAGLVEDEDLKRIISGIYSIVDGVGALRTHASSAHGQGRKAYKIEPRHARLAINSAHTVAAFILETWDKKKTAKTESGSLLGRM